MVSLLFCLCCCYMVATMFCMVARVFSTVLFMLLLCGCYHVLNGFYAVLCGN